MTDYKFRNYINFNIYKGNSNNNNFDNFNFRCYTFKIEMYVSCDVLQCPRLLKNHLSN